MVKVDGSCWLRQPFIQSKSTYTYPLFSLILLVIEAGIDIDLSTLKVIGTRGCLIAFFGSIIPIGLGMLITWGLGMTDTKEIIAAGSVFGPTSLGIALNILRNGGILNT